MQYQNNYKNDRDGVVLPLLTVSLIAVFGLVALAIDIGLMAVARSQCQSAADISALAGARTLDGRSSSNNVNAAVSEAQYVATSNMVLNSAITPAQVASIYPGVYRYDSSAARFQGVVNSVPGPNEAYGLIQVTITTTQPTFFGRIMGVQSLNVGAVATAVHRPRDIAVVLDFSGSMGFSSQFKYPVFGTVTGTLNPDPLFPQFGPWSIFGGKNMVLDPNNPGTSPTDLSTYAPPTPLQRVWSLVDNSGESFGPSNFTIDTQDGPAIVNNFLLSDNSTNAFSRDTTQSFPSFSNVNSGNVSFPATILTPAPSTFVNQTATGFVGDSFPLRQGAPTSSNSPPTPEQYAQTVADYLGISRASVVDTTYDPKFETYGYDWNYSTASLKSTSQRYQGFTMGPGYYGKTFYMWPPDPRTPKGNIGDSSYVAGDWRQRFFSAVQGSGQDPRDNSMFWSINGRWKLQYSGSSTNYIVNYTNILSWLKRGPLTTPPSLRSGRVVYYNSIPDTITVDSSTGIISASATSDQRFWKDYIDYVIGAGRYIDANVLAGANSQNGNTNNNASLYYNSPSTSGLRPKITSRAAMLSGAGTNPIPNVRYDDNPIHPRMQFWFGPTTMLAYMQERFNSLPGTCYEAPLWQLKVGINAALNDIQNNHPNDLASLIFFSSSPGYGTARVSLGRNYSSMQNALFFPYPLLNSLSDSTSTIVPFSTVSGTLTNPAGIQDNNDTIIPNGGTQTCPQSAFMAAYNQLGNGTDGSTVYQGRTGAAKMVIFETDGVPNATASASLTRGGTGYYYDTPGNISYSGNSTSLHVPAKDGARSIVRQIVASNSANPPGYSTARLPARVHAIGFGQIFEPSMASPMQTAAFQFLAAVQIDGLTSPTPTGNWDTDSLDYNANYVSYEPYKIITGTPNDRINKMQQALQRIMQSGIQVALIQ